MRSFRIANALSTFGLLFVISGVVVIVLVFGFYTDIFSRATLEEFPHPISIPLERPCSGNKEKKFSVEVISKITHAHAKWIENPKGLDGSRANFCEADLSRADFVMAMLAGADFSKAKLEGAKLTRANLTRADFTEAQLHGAHFDAAMLHEAVFHDVEFGSASLQYAKLYQANLQGANLRKVQGLTQYQINMACLDQNTKLPAGLSHPEGCT